MSINISARLSESLVSILDSRATDIADLLHVRENRTQILESLAWIGVQKVFEALGGDPAPVPQFVAQFVAQSKCSISKIKSKEEAPPRARARVLDLDLDLQILNLSSEDQLRACAREEGAEEEKIATRALVFENHARLFPSSAPRARKSELAAFERLWQAGFRGPEILARQERDYLESGWLRGEKLGEKGKLFQYWFATFSDYLIHDRTFADFRKSRRRNPPPSRPDFSSGAKENSFATTPRKPAESTCPNAQKRWDAMASKLKRELGAEQYSIWCLTVRPTKLAEDGRLSLEVPTHHHLARLQRPEYQRAFALAHSGSIELQISEAS